MRKTMSIEAITGRMAAGILTWCVVSTPAEVTAGVAASTNTQTYVQLERLIEAVNMGNSVAPGVTPSGVTNYVAASVGQAISNSTAAVIADTCVTHVTANVAHITTGVSQYTVTATMEFYDVVCLTAYNCTAEAVTSGITNGVRWASRGNMYVGRGVPSILRGASKFTCGPFSSKYGFPDSFYQGTNLVFSTAVTRVTESTAKQIAGEQ